MTLEFRKLDQRYGGGAAVDAALGFSGYARRMIHSTADQRTHRDLKVLLADFSSMLGWSFHDIGDQAAARRFLMNALVLAKERTLACSFGPVPARSGQHASSQADRGTEDAPAWPARGTGRGRSSQGSETLHANEALAYAMLAKHDHVLDALARAEDEMGRADKSRASP
jgi:hypothetical protein